MSKTVRKYKFLIFILVILSILKIDFRFKEELTCCSDDFDYFIHAETIIEDFDFDLPLQTKSFRFRAPGQTSIVIQGNRLDNKAKSMLSRIKNGQTVIISDIEVIIPSNPSYKLKQTSPISITIN